MSKARDIASAAPAPSTVSATEIGYLDGVTSAIQTQIDSKIGSASAINPTIVDAKGDIIAATTADTVARLAVGANDTVLTADSTEATGLKWATVSAFQPILTPEIATQFIKTFASQGAASNSVLGTTNTTYYIPIFLPTFSADRISFRTSGGTTTGNYRMGLYNASSTTGLPTTVAFDAGTVSVNAQNTDFSITITQSITAGYYYLAINRQSGGYEFIASGGNAIQTPQFAATGATFNGSPTRMFTQASVTGAFATATSLTANSTDGVILMGLRIA
jgi:hypothetical protein